jgi:hypothetical protein
LELLLHNLPFLYFVGKRFIVFLLLTGAQFEIGLEAVKFARK